MLKIKYLSIILWFTLQIAVLQTNLAQENNNLKTLLINGKYQEVINILEEKLNEEDSISFTEYNILGNEYLRLMNYSKANLFLYKASKMQPNNIQNLISLGNSYLAIGDEVSAKNTFEKVLEIDPVNKMSLINLAKILMEIEDYSKALDLYKKLVTSDSTNAYFLSQLGICEHKKGNNNLAKQILKKASLLNINDTKSVLLLAKLFYNDQQYFDAANLLQEAIKVSSKNKSLNKMLANVFYKNKQYNEAIIKYLYCNTIGDTSFNTYQKLGMSYYYLSFTNSYEGTEVRKLKLREGIEALKLAAEKNSNDPLTFLYLGLCYKELNEDTLAIKYFEETLNKVFPDYLSEVYYNLGSSYDKIEKFPEAIKTYKESLKYNPSRKIIYFYLANLYDRYYADKSVAVLYYKKFIDEDKNADENLIGYSLNRINSITKEKNF